MSNNTYGIRQASALMGAGGLRRILPLALALLAASAVWADSMSQVTTQSGQSANDSISWAQLGADGTTLSNAFSVKSANNTSMTIGLTGSNSQTSVVCGSSPCSWTGSGFTAQDTLLWSSDAANGGNGPVTVTFNGGVLGAGALIQADAPGAFTAQIQAYNATTLLAQYTVSSSSGAPVYAGVADATAPNVTSVVFSLTSCASGCSLADFALDTVSVHTFTGGVITTSPATTAALPFNFGTLVPNTSQTQQFTATNTGTGTVNSIGVAVTGTYASYYSQSNNCPSSLPINGHCTINVTFTPKASGNNFTASIAISDDAASSPQSIYLTGNSGPVPISGPLQFIPVTPCRIADTRTGQGFSGQYGPPELGAQSTRNFVIPGVCGIPSTAVAYSLNVTVVPDASLAYLTVWPAGQTQPTVSTLNSDGRIKANAAIVPAGTSGGISVYAYNSTNLILDVNGYFVPAGTTGALAFYPLTPCRLVDTRGPAGSLGAPSLSGGSPRSFPILSNTNSCSSTIPANAQAYSLNFTALPHTTLAYLTIWPSGQSQPNVSTLNAGTGTYSANAAIVPANGSNGAVSAFASNDTDLLIDINGYFAPPGSTGPLSLYTLPPCRVLDTRGPSYNNAPFSGELTVNVASSSCQVPSTAQGYVLNATVVPPGQLVYLTLWPDGQTQPIVSTLNAIDGATTSNMAIVLTTNGSIDAFAYNPTQLLVDVSSYFAP